MALLYIKFTKQSVDQVLLFFQLGVYQLKLNAKFLKQCHTKSVDKFSYSTKYYLITYLCYCTVFVWRFVKS